MLSRFALTSLLSLAMMKEVRRRENVKLYWAFVLVDVLLVLVYPVLYIADKVRSLLLKKQQH